MKALTYICRSKVTTFGAMLGMSLALMGCRKPAGLSGADPKTYSAMVKAFYVGVTAMEVDDNARARDSLTVATTTIPDEPAAWADLGLVYIRDGNLENASRNLYHALSLAPDSSAIEVLIGLLESQRGDFDKAIDHLRKAIELNPRDLRARYALATMLDRRGGNADPDEGRQFDELINLQPGNQALLMDAARWHAKRGDRDAVAVLLVKLEAGSERWPPAAKEQLKAVTRAQATNDARGISTALVRLRNTLLPFPPFQRDMAAVDTSSARVGEPIQRFIKLPSPPSDPAAPDDGLTFVAAGQSASLQKMTCAVPAWLGADDAARIFIADAQQVRPASGSGGVYPFPGGPSATAPAANGVVAIDWNNDFSTGLVLAGAGGVRLIQPQKDGSFKDVTAAAIADEKARGADYTGAWGADIDLDGDVDILLAARQGPPTMLRNNGDGTFNVLHPFDKVSSIRQFVWTDLDGDGVPDACFVDERGVLSIWINDRGVAFHASKLPASIHDVVSIVSADLTRRGNMDLVALLSDREIVRIFDDGSGTLQAAPVATVAANLIGSPTNARLLVADIDGNGASDLLVATADKTIALLGGADGRYSPLPQPIGMGVQSVVADATAPLGLRLVGLAPGGQPLELLPRGTKNYHFQVVRARANETGLKEVVGGKNKVNAFAIGGEMELRSGLLYQSQPINSGATHFGLGANASTDVVRILWPNGSTQGEFDLGIDQSIRANQRLKGSCPTLFTFDGKQMQFVTDLIWRSPLGLRINAQNTASTTQTEDWVKIGREQLVPHDGYYDLRVTAELWETHFFDQISLMTVDHPSGTEIFVDERFAMQPPPLKVFITTPTAPFSHVLDQTGADVSSVVRERDGSYLGSFARGQFQGVATDHWVELELPADAPTAGLALIGFGWVHPTDSSINVAMAQGNHPRPAGLSIEVPDAEGHWSVARDGVGFPAGKNKTIVLPLDGIFKPGAPRKLRLRTNLEVYWDSLRWARFLDPSLLQTKRLAAHDAQLRYRGFSVTRAADAQSPELPNYQQLAGAAPQWLDLTGFYTRYGDVRELLERVDDRYVIMNAGDEMRLQFIPPPPPASGSVRDFVLISDGWEKDGDYNTAFSRTVLPLPRHDWPAYDVMPERLEADPAYQRNPDDWVNYHTRFVTPRPYRQSLRPADHN